MKQVRRNVFETNSSSTHSVSISSGGVLEDNLMEVEDDGYIHLKFGEFGWDWETYYDQESKLSYLVLMILCTHNMKYPWCINGEYEFDSIMESLNDVDEYIKLQEDIAEYTHTNGFIMDYSLGYIDHQSYESYSSMEDFLNDYGIDSAITFVFSSDIALKTGNDNC